MEKSMKYESDKIWDEIQSLEIDVYALPSTVSAHIKKIDLPGDVLYVKLASSAVLPALEVALGKRFAVENATAYTIIRRVEDRDSKVAKALAEMAKREVAGK